MSGQLRKLLTAFDQAQLEGELLQLVTRLRETALLAGLPSFDSISEPEDRTHRVMESKPGDGVNGISDKREMAVGAHPGIFLPVDRMREFLMKENREGWIDSMLTLLDETAEKVAVRGRSVPGILLDVAA